MPAQARVVVAYAHAILITPSLPHGGHQDNRASRDGAPVDHLRHGPVTDLAHLRHAPVTIRGDTGGVRLKPEQQRRLVRLSARESRLRTQHHAAAAELRAALRDARAHASLAELAALIGRSRQRVHALTR